jgi:hypothetical protein
MLMLRDAFLWFLEVFTLPLLAPIAAAAACACAAELRSGAREHGIKRGSFAGGQR